MDISTALRAFKKNPKGMEIHLNFRYREELYYEFLFHTDYIEEAQSYFAHLYEKEIEEDEEPLIQIYEHWCLTV